MAQGNSKTEHFITLKLVVRGDTSGDPHGDTGIFSYDAIDAGTAGWSNAGMNQSSPPL